MGNLMASFNAGVSGLHSAQASLNTTSHNLANAQTKGYTRQQVIVTDSFYQNTLGNHDNLLQTGTGTTIVTTRQVRNEFLDEQYRLQVGRQSFYEANQKAVYEIEDMMGELEGEQFQASIVSLKNALSSLAADPSDIVYKDELVSVASQFIERAQVLKEQLDEYQTSLNTEVRNQVDAINNYVEEIRYLNKQIQKFEATGESANDYRDKRNQYLDELSKIINFSTTEERDGTIMIYSEGAYLLDSSTQYYLTVDYESDTSKLLKPVWESGGDYFQSDSLEFSTEQNTDVGSLRGIMVARGNYSANYANVPSKPVDDDYRDADGVLDTKAYNQAMIQYREDIKTYNETIGASAVMTIQSQLDTLIHGIVTQVNDVLCPNKEITLSDGTTITVLDEEKALVGDDENNTIGAELFSRRNCERYEKSTVKVLNGDGDEESLEVYIYNPENKEDKYSLYTIEQLVVNPIVLQDSSTIPTMYSKDSETPNAYAYNEIGSIAASFDNDIGTLNPNSMTTYNVYNYYGAMIGEMSVTGNVWNGIIANQELTVTSLETERQNVMGVSSDEELSDLIKFQRCYDASSRYITTISEMLEYLIEKLGG